MSTALWANTLIDGKLFCDEMDKVYLYKHTKKLDKLSKMLNVTSFLSAQDFTDMEFNISDKALPEGMDSTNQLMVQSGVWVKGSAAVAMIESLITHIVENNVKFGMLRNATPEVLKELKESLELAKKANEAKGHFNFSVVT